MSSNSQTFSPASRTPQAQAADHLREEYEFDVRETTIEPGFDGSQHIYHYISDDDDEEAITQDVEDGEEEDCEDNDSETDMDTGESSPLVRLLNINIVILQ